MRIRKPAGLYGRISPEHAARVTGEAEPILVLGAGPQSGIAARAGSPAAADEDQYPMAAATAATSYHPLDSHHHASISAAPVTTGCRRQKCRRACWYSITSEITTAVLLRGS